MMKRKTWRRESVLMLVILAVLPVIQACGGMDPNDGPTRADVQVRLQGPDAAIAGKESEYTVVVSNLGPAAAENVVATVTLPEGMSVASVSDGGATSGQQIRWPATPTVAAGKVVNLTFNASPPLVGPFTLSAAATSGTDDPAPGNNDGQSQLGMFQGIVGFEALYTVSGSPGEFGWKADNVGDVDGDGAGDFTITAKSDGGGAGAAYVYSGATGNQLYVFRGAAGEQLGFDVDAAKDLDGDGIRDMILGGPELAGKRGRVRVYSLATGAEVAVLDGENDGDQFGTTAGFAGDVDGDGTVDIIVGAPGANGDKGRVYLYSGADFTLLYTIDGTRAGSTYGQTARGIGDVSGDGTGDFAVAAPAWPGGGRIFVYSGADGSDLYQIPPGAGASSLGLFWVSSPGDVNGDGVPDILTADIGYSGGLGRVYVFSGVDGSLVHAISGENAGDQLAITHPAGDVDGDGTPDFVAAAWLSSEGANHAGKSYVFSGATGKALRTFTSTVANEQSGFDVFALDDLNGDGITDYVITGNVQTNGSNGPSYVIAGIRR